MWREDWKQDFQAECVRVGNEYREIPRYFEPPDKSNQTLFLSPHFTLDFSNSPIFLKPIFVLLGQGGSKDWNSSAAIKKA